MPVQTVDVHRQSIGDCLDAAENVLVFELRSELVQPTYEQVLVVVAGLSDCAGSWRTATRTLVVLCASFLINSLFLRVRLFLDRPESGLFRYSPQLVGYVYLDVRPVVVRMKRWLVLRPKRILCAVSHVLWPP